MEIGRLSTQWLCQRHRWQHSLLAKAHPSISPLAKMRPCSRGAFFRCSRTERRSPSRSALCSCTATRGCSRSSCHQPHTPLWAWYTVRTRYYGTLYTVCTVLVRKRHTWHFFLLRLKVSRPPNRPVHRSSYHGNVVKLVVTEHGRPLSKRNRHAATTTHAFFFSTMHL